MCAAEVDAFAHPPDVAEDDERGRESRLHEVLTDQSIAIEAPNLFRIFLHLLEGIAAEDIQKTSEQTHTTSRNR